MKTKRFCKSTVSLILALIMLVSMCSVALTSVSAAVTDVAETGATKVYFKGGFNNWNTNYEFATSGTNNVLEVTVTIATSGTYEFKVDDNSVWYGMNDTTVTNTTGGSWYNMYTDTSNAKWKVDAGTYLVKWNTSDKELWIEKTNGGGSGGDSGDTDSDTFPFTFTDGERTVYLVNKAGWATPTCYAWVANTTTSNDWPGVAMADTGQTMNGYKIYSYVVPDSYNMVIFSNNGSSKTADLSYTQYAYYTNSDNAWKVVGSSGSGGTTDPTTLTKLYFMDNSSNSYMTDEDADIYAKFDNESKAKAMKQRVDTVSGKTLWNIKVPEGASSVTFTRKNKLGSTLGSGTWTVSLSDKTSGYYKAAGSSSGSWENDESTFSPSSDSDITNFWYGVWVDTKGEGKGTDAVRWWKDSSGKYHIFLPTHTPDTFKLYTSFNNFTVNGKTASKDNPVDISGITYGQSYSATYQAKAGGSTTACSVTFHKSENVSSLMLFTDDQLWTKTIYSSIPDVSGYKDGIETKGSIYLYDNEGNLVNNVVTEEEDQTVLKKFKGRGNSSFEASMKMYGKYAYNFNLDERVALVDGATETKKWCLLANNVDHAMLRNTFTYNLANDIGLAYSPKTRHVDVYDNGEYIGAYTIIEKVEYGKKTLMNGLVSLDDEHESWYEKSTIYDEDVDYDDDSVIKSVEPSTKYTAASGGKFTYKYWTSKKSGYTYEHADDSFKTKFNFLLEHELSERYESEASWFKSERTGQHVVVKYPEFATEKELKWAMDMYDKLEKAAYETKTLSSIEAAADAESFAKMYLIQELALNLDACATSYYIYNDREANKLVAGPTWDFDWSFGSYHKTKITYNGTSSSLDNPRQMYVKDKDINNNISGGQSRKRNLQAQLTQTNDYWTLCKKIWTNDAQPVIKTYIDENTKDSTDTGILLGWMNDIEASVEMNNIRWNHTYEKDETEDWGTKLTSNYNKGSYDFKPGTGNSAGSASKSYKNTVYYLNDWIKTRMDYMSDNGGLYDATLLDPVELKSVTLNATQSGATVNVSVEIIATDDGVDISEDRLKYDLYVGGKLEGTHSASESVDVTLEENKTTEIYAVGKVLDENGNVDKTMKSNKESFTYVVTGPEYKVENVKFEGVQSANESTVTVTPAATVTCDGEAVKPADINYTVYLNGAAYVTNTFATASVEVSLTKEIINEIYIVVSPVDNTSVKAQSAIQKFPYGIPDVSFTVKFKSSSSYRYVPTVTVNGTEYQMTKEDIAIAKNASGTQSYYWYTADVKVKADDKATLTFTNSVAMNASATISTVEADKAYYFGVDNLNSGTAVTDLTDADVYVRNFVKSATNMVTNDPEAVGVATTSIDGTIYKMGDADGDNDVTILDATTAQLALAKKTDLSEIGTQLADYNLDGTNSISDATNTQVYLAQG